MNKAYRFMGSLMGLSLAACVIAALLFCLLGEAGNAFKACVTGLVCAALGYTFERKATLY